MGQQCRDHRGGDLSEGVRYHLTTKDLVTVALLSALGGVLSTYIGYLGNLINHIFGVPFGAGQFMAGLHVVWIILAAGITQKKGAATVTGFVKGLVELFMGSTHGIVIVLVSLVQGGIVDIVLFGKKAKAERSPIMYGFAGALASASNVIVFQIFFFSGVPIVLIFMITMLAAASGIIFCGWMGTQMLASLERAGLVELREEGVSDQEAMEPPSAWQKRVSTVNLIAALCILGMFTIGAVYYFFAVYQPPNPGSIEIKGDISNSYSFVYEDFQNQEVTINAELIGSVTHKPPRDYTGVPLSVILAEASPSIDASRVTVAGTDGYTALFVLSDVMSDDELIVTFENGVYTIVAANYDGAYWVEDVASIDVS
jgi:ABC-type thiamin/hydroxymethylpyrimidine transport system permease subunit